jgi:DNA-binding protein H-NS
MATYKELLEQMRSLQNELSKTREKEVQDVIEAIRAKVAEYGLTEKDIFGARGGRGKATATLPPKYRDPKTGAEWSGRGRPPAWIKGVKRPNDFLIVDASTDTAAKKSAGASKRFSVKAESGMAGDARQKPKRKPTVPDVKND